MRENINQNNNKLFKNEIDFIKGLKKSKFFKDKVNFSEQALKIAYETNDENQNLSAITYYSNIIDIDKYSDIIFNKDELNKEDIQGIVSFLNLIIELEEEIGYSITDQYIDIVKSNVNKISFINPEISETGIKILKIKDIIKKLQ